MILFSEVRNTTHELPSTVRFRVTAAQDPAGPQPTGGLDDPVGPTAFDLQCSLTYTGQPRDWRLSERVSSVAVRSK